MEWQPSGKPNGIICASDRDSNTNKTLTTAIMVRYNIEVEEMPGVHDAAWRIALWWVFGVKTNTWWFHAPKFQNQMRIEKKWKIRFGIENRIFTQRFGFCIIFTILYLNIWIVLETKLLNSFCAFFMYIFKSKKIACNTFVTSYPMSLLTINRKFPQIYVSY